MKSDSDVRIRIEVYLIFDKYQYVYCMYKLLVLIVVIGNDGNCQKYSVWNNRQVSGRFKKNKEKK